MKIISNIEKINKSEKRARKGWGLHLIGRFFFWLSKDRKRQLSAKYY